MTEHLPWTDAAHLEMAVELSDECKDLDFSEDPYQTALRFAHRLDTHSTILSTMILKSLQMAFARG